MRPNETLKCGKDSQALVLILMRSLSSYFRTDQAFTWHFVEERLRTTVVWCNLSWGFVALFILHFSSSGKSSL